jgi:adenine-specific DNA-methyltransferase
MGSQQDYSGRLELTWTNKDQRLLAHDDGSYEWLPPADYRVAEVRLLDDAGTVGKTRADRSRAKDNLLIRGDALNALTSLAELPEFAKELVGKVRLAYLDPPFNTQQSFLHYDDALEHSVWLTMMRDRLLQVKRLLADNGSVWVHCDDSEQAHLKVMMDEIFGPENFLATIVWQKVSGRENRTHIGTTHDYLVAFSINAGKWMASRNLLPYGEEQLARYSNPDEDPRGPWQSDNITGQARPGRRAAQFFDIVTPGGRTVSPPPGRCWLVTQKRFDELAAENRVWFGADGENVPRLKRFLSETQGGLVPVTWWPYQEAGSNDEAKKELKKLFPEISPFDTPKPERLMQRVIQIGSDSDEIVLDAFLGSGTTAAVAHKMGRHWIGIERSEEALDTFAIPRLSKVVAGEDPGGITSEVDWSGGQGFRILDVAPSMFAADGGVVVLADWATNGKLAEATAAQLGFEFASDPPFAGRKGRTRLAVIDGLVSNDVVELIARALGEGERVVVCGTAVDPGAGKALRELRPGSSVRKIPASILDEYRQARWNPKIDRQGEGSVNGGAPEAAKPDAKAKAKQEAETS